MRVFEGESSSEPTGAAVPATEAMILLESAFKRFEQTGSQLEEKHRSLQQEIDRLHEQLRQKEEEIKRSERLATLGNMAAAIAHEVRNPLGALRLFLSLLGRESVGQPNSVLLVKQSEQCIHNIDRVVSNILQFATAREAERVLVNGSALVAEVVQEFQHCSPSNVEVRCREGESVFLLANASMFRQVVVNLVQNACQACKAGSRVDVDLKRVDGGVELRVRDNGPGIPESIRERLFEPFVTGRKEGTGLGLAIVRQIASAHGGSSWFETSQHGTTFYVKFADRGPQT